MAEDGGGAVKRGYLKKLKTMKKKYFVLKGETPDSSARLEYYESEKKWKCGGQAKKVIPLKSCFNITRRLDLRQRHVVALYMREECLCLVADGEEELLSWLEALLQQLHPGTPPHATPHPRQHVWQVNVQKKGLGASKNIIGLYNLWLTDKTLTLVKIRPINVHIPADSKAADTIEYSLTSIRRCGDSECFFYMEVGRSSVTGAGELWMHTEDPNIAQSMHATILHAMSNSANAKDELGPKSRLRSSSANEASKPITVLARRQTHTGSKPHGLSPSSENTFCSGRSCVGLCISPCENQSAAYCAPQQVEDQEMEEETPAPMMQPNPPLPAPMGAQAVAGGTPVEGPKVNVVHERTRSLPLTGEESSAGPCVLLTKTRSVDKAGSSLGESPVDRRSDARLAQCNGSYAFSKRRQKPFSGARRASTGCRLGKSSLLPSQFPSGGIQMIGGGVRERCDSLPSGGAAGGGVGGGIGRMAPPPPPPAVAAPHRPHSMYSRGISHSPPGVVANSPLSPHSGAYSTDSAGSSVSIDEPDNFSHTPMLMDDTPHIMGRHINSRTPDERSIPEEAGDETLCFWQPEKLMSESLEKGSSSKGLSESLEKNFSSFGGVISLKDHYPLRKSSIGGAPEMSSPVPIIGMSPQDSAGYMPMSPASTEPIRMVHSRVGCNSSNHSRTSSLAEEMLDGGPLTKTDDGYVDMEPSKDGALHTMSPAASTCSVTSGTPSTDIRFSEFHLEKVTSYFTPSEEDEENRPARAYSVGSRPEHVKKVINRPETHSSVIDSSRTRAFSVGSRSRNNKDNRILNHGTPPHCQLTHIMGSSHTGTKSSSTPILASYAGSCRPSYNSTHSSVEPLDDLMEMDFTNRSDSSSSMKTEMAPPPLPPVSVTPVSNLVASVLSPTAIAKAEGYMDMAPVAVMSSGYVEMKPADPSSGDNSATKMIPEIARKVSLTKSPHTSEIMQGIETMHVGSPSSTPDGYVEMSWKTTRAASAKSHNRNRISSLPITINSNNPKDSKIQPSSASPMFNIASFLKGVESSDKQETKIQKDTPPKVSPGISPVTPVSPSPFSSLKRSKKHHTRRNSKESVTPVANQSQTIFPFSLNSPGSPMKPFSNKSPLSVSEITPDRKCPVDGSSGTLKLSHMQNADNVNTTPEIHSIEKTIANSFEAASDYMEMVPNRLTTVRENECSLINKPTVDKDMKQLLNNATKVSRVLPPDFDYINLNPNAPTKAKLIQQKSVDESSSRMYPFIESMSKTKPPNGNQSIMTCKLQNIPRKISVPAFSTNTSLIRNTDSNCKENQGFLSSNPLASKTLVSNPLTKSNVNINQVQIVKKPILVISQTQTVTANFKPIAAGEMCEPRNVKSGSPKPVESVLNRQLAGTLYDNKCKGDLDGYESLMSQNGQHQKLASRPSSVNNKKKGNGSGSRPPSVNSESGGAPRSRPSSVSSELGGTPGGSRPGSVVGEREREGSRLHYASLELDPPAERSPRPPTTPLAVAPAFTYAQIDFAKCEELKNSKNSATKSKN